MILAIDAGNTRIKWGLWEDRGFVAQGSILTAHAASLPDALHMLPRPGAAIGSNVAGGTVRAGIEGALAPWSLPVRWIASLAAQCGVTSRYESPAQLGTDRWAALIGARARTDRACLVVNAGTAVTIDALDARGIFHGGLILPGLELMARSLAAGTADLPLHPGRFGAFPVNSVDAIRSGALQAVAGAVERMAGNMVAAQHGEPQLILSGGAGEVIGPILGRPYTLAPALVLEGLVEIARAA
jgi:type III pantothenate kinase